LPIPLLTTGPAPNYSINPLLISDQKAPARQVAFVL